jgi:hypothetical protein
MMASIRTVLKVLGAAFALAACGSPPAQAQTQTQTWQVIDQPGGYKVARVTTGGASGLVQGIGLTCERKVAMIALSLARAPARNPALLSLSDGKATGKLGVVRDGVTNVWAGPVRDPRVLAMLARAGSVEVAVDGVRYGTVSLTGAADAMRGALGGCWAEGAVAANTVGTTPAAPVATGKPMLPIKPGYYVGTFDKQCATASSAMYYDGGNRLGDTSESLRTIKSATRSRDGEYEIEFIGQVDDDVAGSDGMFIKPINADRIKVTTNDFTEMRLCAVNTLPKQLLVGGVGAAPVVASPPRSQAGGIRLAAGSAGGSSAALSLPLRFGTYVHAGKRCGADKSWQVFIDAGFGGVGPDPEIHSRIESLRKTGTNSYVVREDVGAQDTYVITATYTITDREHFTVRAQGEAAQSYSYCPLESLPLDQQQWPEGDHKEVSFLPIKPGYYLGMSEGDTKCEYCFYHLFRNDSIATVYTGFAGPNSRQVLRQPRILQTGALTYSVMKGRDNDEVLHLFEITSPTSFTEEDVESIIIFRPIDPAKIPARFMPRF